MANFSWTFDAPSGVFKNHALSSDIRMAAIAEAKFAQFVKPESGYGKKKGESVTIIRVSNLTVPTSGRLTENIKIPEDALTITTVAITVSEFGRAVPYTNLAEQLGELNLENSIQATLKDQMKLVLDNACASAFKTAKIKYVASGVAASTITTNGTAGALAVSNLNMFHVEAIRDYLYGTLFAPAFEGDDYIGLVSTKAKRGVVSDPNWEEWHVYTDPQSKYNGEIGRVENIRFIEVNNASALAALVGSSTVCGEAVFFGMDAVAMAVVQDPELLAELPRDFGRQKAVAWYGILDFGIIWDTGNPGEARIVHVTST